VILQDEQRTNVSGISALSLQECSQLGKRVFRGYESKFRGQQYEVFARYLAVPFMYRTRSHASALAVGLVVRRNAGRNRPVILGIAHLTTGLQTGCLTLAV
jgi:hypothetical protein